MTDLSPDAKALLHQARTDFSPSENRLAKVRSSLATQIAASQPEPGASHAAPRSTGAPAPTSSAVTWTIGHTLGTAVLIGALGAAGLATWRTRASTVAAPHVQPTSEMVLAAPVPTNEPPKKEKPVDNGTPLLAVPTAAPTAVARTQGRPRSKADLPREISADPLVTTTPLTTPVVAPPNAPVTTPPSAFNSPPQTAPVVPFPAAPFAPPSAPEVADSLADEVHLLRKARAALDHADPSRALALLDDHAARFPRGTLYEERLATRVLALCAMGRVAAARLAAQELERAAPRSPHLGRVRASCIGIPATP